MKTLFLFLISFIMPIVFAATGCNMIYKALEDRFNLPPIERWEWYAFTAGIFISLLYFIHGLRVFLRVLDDKKEN